MNVNNFGPKSMGADLAKQVKDLGKLDEKKGVGEAQQATSGDRPEGDTVIYPTIVETWGYDKDGNKHLQGVFYDGIDNGVVVAKDEYGNLEGVFIDNELHDTLKDYPNSNPYGD